MCLALLFRLLQSTSRLSLFPYTTLFRSAESSALGGRPSRRAVSFPDSRAVRATRPARRSCDLHRNAAPDVSLELLASRGRKPDRKSTRLNSSHSQTSYAVFCLKKKIDTQ